ncbi:hypothetical protein KIN20_034769 [Parelaphostrongylus tenuis]|uniref:Uncharacterized protein n=1 Tax=Parelaphostrongylus tenuis TaxID=148309 RepID=A0AAD5RA87_PARTN|nr:hypothetical protein KIN20_034769 [Parelaphostrongylus tenuis]
MSGVAQSMCRPRALNYVFPRSEMEIWGFSRLDLGVEQKLIHLTHKLHPSASTPRTPRDPTAPDDSSPPVWSIRHTIVYPLTPPPRALSHPHFYHTYTNHFATSSPGVTPQR